MSDSENDAGELRQAQPHGERNTGAEQQANTARQGPCIGFERSRRIGLDKGHWGSSGWRRATADEGERVGRLANSRSCRKFRTAQGPAKFRAIPYGRLRMWLTVASVAGSARSGPPPCARDTLDSNKARVTPTGHQGAGARNSIPALRSAGSPPRSRRGRAIFAITAKGRCCSPPIQLLRGLRLRIFQYSVRRR